MSSDKRDKTIFICALFIGFAFGFICGKSEMRKDTVAGIIHEEFKPEPEFEYEGYYGDRGIDVESD